MIVVTGMHRSGTSAVAMTMEALGVDFGEHTAFHGADEWNERGYFERSDVIDLNSRLLTGVPRTRGQPQALWSQLVYLANPSPAAAARRKPQLEEEMSALASRLRGMAVKDPRFCLTLPAWQPHVDRTVVVLRHPGAVAGSLHRRQHVPRLLGLRFWNRHAEALLDIGSEEVLFIDFDVLRGDGPGRDTEVARLVSFLDLELSHAAAIARLDDQLSERLVHFEAGAQDLPARTRLLWAGLQERRRAQR